MRKMVFLNFKFNLKRWIGAQIQMVCCMLMLIDLVSALPFGCRRS
jgi:hypothetical protein